MLEVPCERDWTLHHWNDRTICRELLEHKLDNKAIDHLTLEQRHAKVYGYARKQMFEDTTAKQVQVLALTNVRQSVQNNDDALVPKINWVCIHFLKNHFDPCLVFSLPTPLLEGAVAAVFPDNLDTNGLMDAVAARPLDDHAPTDVAFSRSSIRAPRLSSPFGLLTLV